MSAIGPQQTPPGRYRVDLRWGDMDALGHVNHVEAVGRSSLTLGHQIIRSDGELAAIHALQGAGQ